MQNLALLSDSYKYSHFLQYPAGTEKVYSYLEARKGSAYNEIVFFGLQYYIKKYLMREITHLNIIQAADVAVKHGEPFNLEGWSKMVEKHNGRLPLEIHAVEEGSINKVGAVLMTIENTDEEFPWITNWAETLLMKLWYPITVASKALAVRRMLELHWDYYTDAKPEFAYHNFGDRGSTSVDAAYIGGMAHLTQFSGTDNFNAVNACNEYYGEQFGFSIPASEHSTVTSWGKNHEQDMIKHYLESRKKTPMMACVLDSYDIYQAVDFVTSGEMKEKIESEDYPIFVIRPDSGDPIKIADGVVNLMRINGVKYTNKLNQRNGKSSILFDKYRLIWGDGVTPRMIDKFLSHFVAQGYSPENFAFGSGGDLMQNITRDTCRFAIKCSAAKIRGIWQDVYKDPITDPGKASKRGRIDGLPLAYKHYGNETETRAMDLFSQVRQRSRA